SHPIVSIFRCVLPSEGTAGRAMALGRRGAPPAAPCPLGARVVQRRVFRDRIVGRGLYLGNVSIAASVGAPRCAQPTDKLESVYLEFYCMRRKRCAERTLQKHERPHLFPPPANRGGG